jgi:hypothetical protein
MKRTSIVAPIVTAIAIASAVLVSGAGTSEAGDSAKVTSCVVSGETPVKADSKLFDAQSKGNAIARLTGASIPLTVSQFPNPLKGRVKVSTSAGKSSVRLEGWADRGTFRYFAARDLPVMGSHVWITKGMELDLVGASAKGFTAKLRILGSAAAPRQVTVPCDGVALKMPSLGSSEPPEKARTYQMRKDSIALYDEPRGNLVMTLDMEEGTRKVFWSTESRAGYVHIVSRADVTIDAWAKFNDLSWTRHAELTDLSAVAPRPFRSRKLAIQDPPAVVVATSDLPIHDKPENRPSPIGVIESGARFYPMEQSGDWTNIMPETLAVLPPDGGGFWVRTAGITSSP